MANDINGLRQALQSPDAEVRGRAMQELLRRVRSHPELGAEISPLFDTALCEESDPWTIVTAAQGITAVRGTDAGQDAFRRLLRHEQSAVAAHAALSVTDPALTPALIERLRCDDDARVQASIIRTLGRLRDPRAFDVLIAQIESPAYRADVIEALGEFGDWRAIGQLQPWAQDRTPVHWTDERGCSLCLGDVACAAIRRLRYRTEQRTLE